MIKLNLKFIFFLISVFYLSNNLLSQWIMHGESDFTDFFIDVPFSEKLNDQFKFDCIRKLYNQSFNDKVDKLLNVNGETLNLQLSRIDTLKWINNTRYLTYGSNNNSNEFYKEICIYNELGRLVSKTIYVIFNGSQTELSTTNIEFDKSNRLTLYNTTVRHETSVEKIQAIYNDSTTVFPDTLIVTGVEKYLIKFMKHNIKDTIFYESITSLKPDFQDILEKYTYEHPLTKDELKKELGEFGNIKRTSEIFNFADQFFEIATEWEGNELIWKEKNCFDQNFNQVSSSIPNFVKTFYNDGRIKSIIIQGETLENVYNKLKKPLIYYTLDNITTFEYDSKNRMVSSTTFGFDLDMKMGNFYYYYEYGFLDK